MSNLRELELLNIATIKEFGLEESFYKLVKITLVGLENFEKWISRASHLFPCLQVLIIENCPKLSELPCSNHIVYPLKQDCNIDWLPKLQKLNIKNCPEVSSLPPIPWTHSWCSVKISDVGLKLPNNLVYSKPSSWVALEISGKDGMHSFDQLLLFSKLTELQELRIYHCPPLELKHFLMLTSLKNFNAWSSNLGVVPSESQSGVEWQHPVEDICISSSVSSGKELTRLLSHLPKLSNLEIQYCENITELAVGVDMHQTIAPVSSSTSSNVTMDDTQAKDEQQEIAEVGKEDANTEDIDDGLLVLRAHLSNSLQSLRIEIHGLVVHSLNALQALTTLELRHCWFSSFRHPFPSSLLYLELLSVKGVQTMEPLSNLTSLTRLLVYNCGEDLRCEGMLPLLTQGQLSQLNVRGSPNFFGGWDPMRGIHDEQDKILLSRCSKLQGLHTDSIEGFLSALALCSLLSSSLTKLIFESDDEMARFTEEQEEAFLRLTSLLELNIGICDRLEHLPAGLNKLTNLKTLRICHCPALRSLPKDGLPSSLRELFVVNCGKLQHPPSGLNKLTNLETLLISSCPAFRSLPKDGLPSSLRELDVEYCDKLEHLPAGLNKLTNLKTLRIWGCPALRSLPKDGLPSSLRKLDVKYCANEELKQQCRRLMGTLPKIIL